MMSNNIDLKALEETKEKIQKGEFSSEKPFEAEGEWLLEGEGQFRGTLEFPSGTLTVVTDQPPPSGGQGRAPNPVQFCVFAMVSCYATTFVTMATQRGIEIKKLRARGGSLANMKAIFDLEEGPVVKKVWVELEVESDAPREELEELRRMANEKCPAAFTVQHSVPFESRLV